MDDTQRTWCANAINRGGDFLSSFAAACYKADDNNFIILEPALEKLMKKYPKYSE